MRVTHLTKERRQAIFRARLCRLLMAAFLIFSVGNHPLTAFAQTDTKAAVENLLAENNTHRPATAPGQSATLLPDGQWLLLGGKDAFGRPSRGAILFNPETNNSTLLSTQMLIPRMGHSATVIPDGTVLIIGGIGQTQQPVIAVERYHPDTHVFESLGDIGLVGRGWHSATMLMNGQLLVTGGLDVGQQVRRDAQLLDARTLHVQSVNSQMDIERYQQRNILLPTDYVLIAGGLDHNQQPVIEDELFDRNNSQFFSLTEVPADALPTKSYKTTSPVVIATLPVANSNDISVNTQIAIRFSKPIRPGSITTDSITLIGPSGQVEAVVTPVEEGLLAFLTPKQQLLPDTNYTLFVQGVLDESLAKTPFSAINFHTKKLNPPQKIKALIPTTTSLSRKLQEATDDETWTPNESNFTGNWRSGKADLARRSLRNPSTVLNTLYAAAKKRAPSNGIPVGVTALTGQVLRLNGKPLADVTLSINTKTTTTDENGEFLLSDLPAGQQVLVIDGATADHGNHAYGRYEYRAEIKSGETNTLPFVIWMTKLDSKNSISIESPTAQEVVVTTPKIPGLELRIPPGTVIRNANGDIVTEINITAIPIDQPPFPLPSSAVPVYFTIQPGGAHLQNISVKGAQGARLIYPNFSHEPPGSRLDFWNYDPRGKGWYVYGQGTVSRDGRQVIPDKGVSIYEFTGAMVFIPPIPAPAEGPTPGGPACGDPVDCFTGIFVHENVDLRVEDVIPIEVRRVYRSRDPYMRAFSVGTNLSYDIFLQGDNNPWTYMDLILPDGSRIHYTRISTGTGYFDAVYQSTTTPGRYFGSTITYMNSGQSGWLLHLKDGTTYSFPNSLTAPWSRCAALTKIQDRYGNTVTLNRDSSCNLTNVFSPNGRSLKFIYDTSRRITQVSDNIGRTVSYQYGGAPVLANVTDAEGKIESYTYDASYNMLTVVDKRGNTMVTNVYNANARVSQQTYADNTTATWSYSLDSAGHVIQTDFTNERGATTRYQFNGGGFTTSITLAMGKPEQQVITYTRNAANLVQSETDALGRITAYQYDSNGNTTQETFLQGTANQVVWKYTYDPISNQVSSVTDPLNRTTTYTHDALGNLIQIKDALNNTADFTYTTAGQIATATSHVAGASLTQTYGYSGGVLSFLTDSLNRTIQFFTDAVGRITTVKDALGNQSQIDYDKLNRVTKTTDSLGQVVQRSYDPNNNLTSFTDGNNHATQFIYDKRNRVITKIDPLTRSESYQYDAAGNLKQITDRKGQVTGYGYDFLNRRTNGGFGATAANPTTYTSTIAYTWDGGDRMTLAADSVAGNITRAFDGLDRLTQEQSPQGTINYSYYPNNLLQTRTILGQTAVNFTYDNANRLTQIAQGATTVGFTYDGASRRSTLTLPSGVVVTYGFDNASELTSLTYQNGATNLGNLTYSYDAMGRRIAIGGSLAQVTLPTAVTSTAINNANQVTNWGGQASTYDNNGAMATQGALTYVWDERQRLSQIKNGSTVTASFAYDAFNRRISKTVSGTTSTFLYDGWQTIKTTTNSTSSYFLTGLQLDEVYRRSGGTTNDFLADGLGSTVALITTAGAISTSYVYEPYGKTSSSASATALQYTGRENDTTGMFYYRNRYYSPGVNRFISEDPMGFAAGQNIYTYVNGDPISNRDPLGLINLQIPGTSGETTVHANPGPAVTPPGTMSEHLPSHVHLGDNNGPRVSTDNFDPLTPDDERRMTRKQKKFCKQLSDTEKDLIRSRQNNVFNKGTAIIKALSGPAMLTPYAYCQADPGRCIDTIDSISDSLQ